MALKTIKADIAPAVPKSKSSGPVFEVEGNICARFNQTVAAIKVLEADKAEMDAELKLQAREAYFDHRLNNPSATDASIKVADEAGGVTRLDFKNVYSVVDVNQAEELFDGDLNRLFPGRKPKIDVNEFVVETVAAKFDSNFFLDVEGNFDQALYDKTMKALEAVVKGSGKPNPLATAKVVKLKPGFHEKRFTLFPSKEAQVRITEVCKNTQALVPVTTPEKEVDLKEPVAETVTKAKRRKSAKAKLA